jgi:hypothetical protein
MMQNDKLRAVYFCSGIVRFLKTKDVAMNLVHNTFVLFFFESQKLRWGVTINNKINSYETDFGNTH